MRVHKVTDINDLTVKDTKYDVGIFAAGYERRSIFVPQNVLNKDNIAQQIVFGYQDGKKDHSRPKNDQYFKENWGAIILASATDDTVIYEGLRKLNLDEIKTSLRMVVDYTTMSRLWYASILNWIRFQTSFSSIEIDFIYANGQYEGDFAPLVIESILALPGYEGSPIFDAQTLAIFGLGFDGLATLGALDYLEPNIVYGYLANPGSSANYPDKAKEFNKVFISNHARTIMELPISSVEIAYRRLAELISPHRGKDNIMLIPMGPKPHVLAAMLLCMRFDKEISCLRIRGKRIPKVNVKAAGEFIVTRVSFN